MKVLLFTHSQDIDGMGCAVIANKAFSDYTLVPTKTFEITHNVSDYIDSGEIYNYTHVFVTDLCIKEPLLGVIDKNEELKKRIVVLDHHKTEILEGNDKYSFVNVIVERDGIKESGTSLFYKYLIENNMLKPTSFLDELVEWTRQYDVYDWVKTNNQNARYLHILFENLGYQRYLEIINKKQENNDSIIYDDEDMSVIKKYFLDLEEAAKDALENMKVVELTINDVLYRVGYVTCLYRYRNDLNEFVKDNNVNDIDCIGMIMTDIDSVSYRGVKDVDVSIIGNYYGGKGHKGAASNSKKNELFIEEVMNKYFN